MAEKTEVPEANTEESYLPPLPKTVSEIVATDAEDESLNKYKAKLLGEAKAGPVIVDASNPKNVIVHSISLVVKGRDVITMRLDKDREYDPAFKIKEGTSYRIQFNFYVQREICAGLKYTQKVTRHSVTALRYLDIKKFSFLLVDKDVFMMGSYAPKTELQSFTSPLEEAPSGLMHRGKYKVQSQVTDDDNHDWLTWQWTLEIAKDW
uniref:Rho GDP-dissociation inhibitor 2 n=1 Tax=Syphacia muris TaxID=451379 RepID=A0A0N5AD68_9BILA